ncbi:MAG: hypothetical protein ACRELD_04585 [Longimicrobiales bacterium]
MFECFPRQTAVVERTHLRYINLPNILNDAKTDRAARITGFVSLFLGREVWWILIERGEPLTAARLREEQREIVPIEDVLDAARREQERADLAYYHVTEAQLAAMYATVASQPLFQAPEGDMGRPGQLFGALQQRAFEGVLELRGTRAVHYVTFEAGRVRQLYLAGQLPGESRERALERIFFAPEREPLQAWCYAPVSAISAQAPLALVTLYRRIVHELVEHSGSGDAVGWFRIGLQRAAVEYPELAGITLEETGEVHSGAEGVASADRLTAAYGAWIGAALQSGASAGAFDPAELVERVTRQHRFALERQGFYQRLPWPVQH